MSFVDSAFSMNAKDPVVVDAGQHKLRIVGASYGPSRTSGRNQFSIMYTAADQANVQPFFDYLGVPDGQDDETSTERKKCRMRDFKIAFNLDPTHKFNVSDVDGRITELNGREGWAMVKQTDDPEYGLQNKVSRYIVGQ
jgi:hypothetical protein